MMLDPESHLCLHRLEQRGRARRVEQVRGLHEALEATAGGPSRTTVVLRSFGLPHLHRRLRRRGAAAAG